MKNERLLAIASILKPGKCMADIGTDHGKLPVYLVRNEIFERAYACDIAQGPLNSAVEHIAKNHLSDKIPCILSNGFEHVPNDIDAAVIAGVGYHTAKDILDVALDRLDGVSQIVVQVNHEVEELRRYISDHHFTIIDEALVYDRKHYYTIIVFTTKYHESYSEEDMYIGPVLKEKRSALFLEYMELECKKHEQILPRFTKKDDQYKETKQQYDFILAQLHK